MIREHLVVSEGKKVLKNKTKRTIKNHTWPWGDVKEIQESTEGSQ